MTKINTTEEPALIVARAIATLYRHKNEFVQNDKIGKAMFKRILNRCLLWDATELGVDEGSEVRRFRYVGVRYWSVAAANYWKKNKKGGGRLVHEHAVPKQDLLAMIEDSPKNVKSITKILQRYAFAVIITKSQDKKISAATRDLKLKNPKWYVHDKWARYRSVGFPLCDTKGNEPISENIPIPYASLKRK